MILKLIWILISFGFATGNINIPTWDEDVAETDTDVIDESIEESIGELLSQMENEDETDLDLESDWDEMESEETIEKEYDLEDEISGKEMILQVNINDQNGFKNLTGTTASDQNITSETSTGSLKILRMEETASKIDINTTEVKTSTGIEESVSGVTATGDQNDTETATGITMQPIGKILSEIEVITGDQNILETATNLAIRSVFLEMNTSESSGFEILSDIGEISSDKIKENSTNLETSTQIGETISEVTMGNQNDLEITPGITIRPILLQMNLNKDTTFETSTGIREISSEVTSNDQSNLGAASDVEKFVLEMTTGSNLIANIVIDDTLSEMTLDDQKKAETVTDTTFQSTKKILSKINTKSNIDLETLIGIGEMTSEVTTGDQNNSEIATEIRNWPVLLEMNTDANINFEILHDTGGIASSKTTYDPIDLETETGVEGILSEVTSGDQNNTETALVLINQSIEKMLFEINTTNHINLETSTETGEQISEMTTSDQNNLEITTGRAAAESITNDQNYSETATSTKETVSEKITRDQNNLKTSTSVREIISEVTTSYENETGTSIPIWTVLLRMNKNGDDNSETTSEIEKMMPEFTTDIESEVTLGAKNNLENVTGMTILPVLLQVNLNKSTKLETATDMEENFFEVTLNGQNDTEITTETTTQPTEKISAEIENTNKTNFETLIALKDINTGDFEVDEGDSKTGKNTQPGSSKMELDDQPNLKISTNRSDKLRGRKRYANKKIERKIADALHSFSSNCNIYKPIKFSLEHFVPPSPHRFRLGPTTYARIHDFTLKESKEDATNWSNYATVINCEMDSMKVQASIPTKLVITARVELLSFPSRRSVQHKGAISVTYTGVSIWGKFNRNGTYEEPMREHSSIKELFPNLYFIDSKATFHGIDKEHHVQVYRAIEQLFKTTKHVHNFFIKELEEKMQENGISYSSSCLNIKNKASDYKSSIPIEKSDLNHLYMIPHVKLEPIKGSIVHAGPIVIDGLLNFKSSEFNRYLQNFGREGNDIDEKISRQITAKDLKGKFQWKHHSKNNVLPFSISQVEFRSFQSNRINRQGRRINDGIKKSKISVKVGKINIVMSHTQFGENENNFANFILSKYLESLISKSLQKSIEKKFNGKLLHEKCDVFIP